jgi:hypothetical protein
MNITMHSLTCEMRPEDAVTVWSITFTEGGGTRRAELEVGLNEHWPSSLMDIVRRAIHPSRFREVLAEPPAGGPDVRPSTSMPWAALS